MTAWRLDAFLLLPAMAGFAFCQPPAVTPAASAAVSIAKNPAMYIVLKASLKQGGTAREAFLLRMAALGASNVRFVDSGGTVAARCTAPASATASIAADADVAGVLPIDDGKEPEAAAGPPLPVLPAGAPPLPISTPPYMQQPPNFPSAGGIGVGGGGGMNMGIAMLTDIASTAIVKLLTPATGCKVSFTNLPTEVPARGGTGAFEVKASGNCAWQAVSTADWLQIGSSVLGPGTAAVSFTVLAHPAGKRQAAVILQVVGGTGPLRGKTVLMVSQE